MAIAAGVKFVIGHRINVILKKKNMPAQYHGLFSMSERFAASKVS